MTADPAEPTALAVGSTPACGASTAPTQRSWPPSHAPRLAKRGRLWLPPTPPGHSQLAERLAGSCGAGEGGTRSVEGKGGGSFPSHTWVSRRCGAVILSCTHAFTHHLPHLEQPPQVSQLVRRRCHSAPQSLHLTPHERSQGWDGTGGEGRSDVRQARRRTVVELRAPRPQLPAVRRGAASVLGKVLQRRASAATAGPTALQRPAQDQLRRRLPMERHAGRRPTRVQPGPSANSARRRLHQATHPRRQRRRLEPTTTRATSPLIRWMARSDSPGPGPAVVVQRIWRVACAPMRRVSAVCREQRCGLRPVRA